MIRSRAVPQFTVHVNHGQRNANVMPYDPPLERGKKNKKRGRNKNVLAVGQGQKDTSVVPQMQKKTRRDAGPVVTILTTRRRKTTYQPVGRFAQHGGKMGKRF